MLGFATQSRSLRHIQKFAAISKGWGTISLGHHTPCRRGRGTAPRRGAGSCAETMGFNKDKLAIHGASGIAVCVSVMDCLSMQFSQTCVRGKPCPLPIVYDRTNKNFWMCRRESGSKSCYNIKMSLIFTCSYSQFPSVIG